VLAVSGLSSGAPEVAAQTFMTQPEALEVAFPEADTVERRTAFLGEGDLDRVRAAAGPDVRVRQAVVPYYVARRGDRYLGAAYFDAHRVRTKEEVVMVVVGPDDRILQVEVLKFSEPPEYVAPDLWIAQLETRALDDDLSLQGDVIGMAGATLTARSMVEAARRVLALHAVVLPFDGGER